MSGFLNKKIKIKTKKSSEEDALDFKFDNLLENTTDPEQVFKVVCGYTWDESWDESELYERINKCWYNMDYTDKQVTMVTLDNIDNE